MKGLLFTYGMTYGGALVSLISPFYGLLVYICFAIVKPEALWHWSVPAGNYSRIIGAAFLLGWMVNGLGEGRLGPGRKVLWCLIGYWVWVMFSTALSPDPALGAPYVEYLAKIVLPFAAGLTLVWSRARLELLYWTIVLSCTYLAYEANMAYLGGFSFATNNFLGLDNNSFSILMAAVFGLAFVRGFVDPVGWRRWFCLGCAAAMAHVPMLAMSRGGMVGVAVATVVAVVLLPKTPATVGKLVLTAVIGSVLAGPSVVEEFNTSFASEETRDWSAQSRVDLWMDCVDAMLRSPLFGVGQEHWGAVAADYGWPFGKEAHSLWFQTAAELGIPGIAFLLAFYALATWQSYKLSRSSADPFIASVALSIPVGLIGFATAASFVTVEGFELPFYIAMVGACALNVASLEECGEEDELDAQQEQDEYVEQDEYDAPYERDSEPRRPAPVGASRAAAR